MDDTRRKTEDGRVSRGSCNSRLISIPIFHSNASTDERPLHLPQPAHELTPLYLSHAR